MNVVGRQGAGEDLEVVSGRACAGALLSLGMVRLRGQSKGNTIVVVWGAVGKGRVAGEMEAQR